VSDGAVILDCARRYVRAYVVMTDAQADAIALWIVHTHALDACETSPYLAITSPERRSGKTRLLEALELVVARPWRVIRPSEAVLYRKIARDRPTLLLDEVDAIYHAKADGNAQALRALLDAGNRRGTSVPRCVGPAQHLTDFAVFGAKALGGIGDLPDTIADRAIPVRLKRRTPAEQVTRFRGREAGAAAEPVYEAVRSWAEYCVDALAGARPALPDALDDRAQDGWEPLLAIADLAGDGWAERARAAAGVLSADRGDADDSYGVQLLQDVRAVWPDEDTAEMATAELLKALAAIEERPWGEWWWAGDGDADVPARGAPRKLAGRLRPYGIRPADVHPEGSEGPTRKGYRRADFEDAWQRYLPPEPEPNPRNPREPAWTKAPQDAEIRADDARQRGFGGAANPHGYSVRADCADSEREQGDGGRSCPACKTPARCAADLSCLLIARAAAAYREGAP
jgi:hypothetical protein